MSAPLPAPLAKLSILITAQEAYPAFEDLFLTAQDTIALGFRIFDPMTKLRSRAACEIGETWADLIVHTLNRGVSIDMTLADFDPIAGYDLHRGSWQAVRIFHALNEMTAANAGDLRVRCLLHPAQGGLLPRILFARHTRKKLREIAVDMDARARGVSPFRFAPRLRDLLVEKDGKMKLRRFVLPRIYPVTLHQKMAVVDEQVLYIGGLDLNDRRYDDRDHRQPAQDTWHDIQIILRDAATAQDALAYLRSLPRTTSGLSMPAKVVSGFRTTLSRCRERNIFGLAPVSVSDGILQEHLKQIRAARAFIYIETQYFRDRRIAKALADAARRVPDLKLLLLLPAAPDDIAFDGSSGPDARFGEYLQTRAIRRVRRAFGNRFFVVTPVQPRPVERDDSGFERAHLGGAPIVYVHAKVSIFDTTCAIVGSANLNGRSLKWDVEAGVVLTTPEAVVRMRQAVFSHWLPQGVDEAFFEPQTALARWTDLAKRNARKSPQERDGFVMPYDLARATQAAMPIPGVPEELV